MCLTQFTEPLAGQFTLARTKENFPFLLVILRWEFYHLDLYSVGGVQLFPW